MAFPEKLPFLLDGATGTLLQKAGMPAGACSEKWILEHPETIVEIQRAYVEAGSDAVYAPTFGAIRPTLDKHGVTESVEELCARLVELSREAVQGKALVIGDMSPSGLMLEPFGETTFEELVEIYAEQARALEAADVDLFGIETQINLEETRAILTAVRQVSQKPVMVSFSCGPTGKTMWGDDLAEAVEELEPMGIQAFGINCCGDLDLLCRVLAEIRENTDLPLIAKPNAGIPRVEKGQTIYDMTPETLAACVPKLLEAGASILGGCCGTTAAHIAAIRAAL